MSTALDSRPVRGVPPVRPVRRGAETASKVVVNGVLGLMALYTLIPLWWLFVSATKGSGYLYTGAPLWFCICACT